MTQDELIEAVDQAVEVPTTAGVLSALEALDLAIVPVKVTPEIEAAYASEAHNTAQDCHDAMLRAGRVGRRDGK